jgi:hypothetical protein
MAVSKGKSLPASRQPSQPKFSLYLSLSNLNVAFEVIAQEIKVMGDHAAISKQNVNLHRAIAEELRSAVNHHVAEALRTREQKDCARYGLQVRKLQPKSD